MEDPHRSQVLTAVIALVFLAGCVAVGAGAHVGGGGEFFAVSDEERVLAA